MIYTVTCNPSLDYHISVDELAIGKVNRVSKERIVVGGKGINVSLVLANLGHQSTVMGFAAGHVGQMIQKLLEEKGLVSDLIEAEKGNSRINIKLNMDESETQINGQGPEVSQQAVRLFFQKIDTLQDGDILVLAGSVQKTLGDKFYGEVLSHLQDKKVKTVVDATGELLTYACKYHPFLIKPNQDELARIFDTKIKDQNDAAVYGKRLLEMGAQNVIISMGGDGAVLLTSDGGIFFANAPKRKVVNTIGAGDSLVAGFLAGLLEKGDIRQAFVNGIAAGSASAFSQEFATKQQVGQLCKEIELMQADQEPDPDAIIGMLDDYVISGGSRMKIQISDELSAGQMQRQYHHGRCDINSPWACGQSFDLLEDPNE